MFLLQAQKNQLAVLQKEDLTSGSVNVYRARFLFSEEWNGLIRTAVFRYGSSAWSVLLDDTGECGIPWEALASSGRPLYAGVYGTRDGEIVLPTVWVSLGTVQEGADTGAEVCRPPTPGVYDQVLLELERRGDGLSYDSGTLSLLAGEKPVASVELVFATDAEVAEALDEIFRADI